MACRSISIHVGFDLFPSLIKDGNSELMMTLWLVINFNLHRVGYFGGLKKIMTN